MTAESEATISRLADLYVELVISDGGSAREVGAAAVVAAMAVADARYRVELMEHVARQTAAQEAIAAALTQLVRQEATHA